jgi:hypothetical protein
VVPQLRRAARQRASALDSEGGSRCCTAPVSSRSSSSISRPMARTGSRRRVGVPRQSRIHVHDDGRPADSCRSRGADSRSALTMLDPCTTPCSARHSRLAPDLVAGRLQHTTTPPSTGSTCARPTRFESILATVRLRQRITKGPGSRAGGVAMAFRLIGSAQARRRAVNAPHLVRFFVPARGSKRANSSSDPTNQPMRWG